MIVKCERLLNPNTKQFHPGPSDRGLTIGNLYSVLEISYKPDEILYRIFKNDTYEYQHPILIRSDEFSIVTGEIPPNWELIRDEYETATLGPKVWQIFEPWEESFWQDWNNNLPKAKKCFDEELRVIFDCDAD